MRTTLLLLLVLAACGKSKPSGDQASSSDEPKRVSNKALIAAPLSTVTSKAGTIEFTIDLPVSLLKPAELSGVNATFNPKDEWLDTPSFTVMFNEFPMSPDDVGEKQIISDGGEEAANRVIARAEKLPDGGYINVDQRKDEKYLRLEVCRPQSGGKLCCSLQQRADKPIEAFKDMLQLGEKACRSMKAKS
ncbi:MAG: hypothetical protein JWO36_1618 [Myxococcales bacterium]|nr:hypothetical protein [Myxococcales bacterium]